MILKSMIKRTLDKLFKYVKEGQFFKGEKLVKKRKILFFFLLRNSLYKSSYFFLFAVFLINRNDYRKAIVYLKKSLYSHRSDISPNLFYLVIAFLKLGNEQQVLYYYKKLLERSHNPFYTMLAHYYCVRYIEDFPFLMDSIKDILPDKPEGIYEQFSFVIYYILSDKLSKAYDIMQKYQTTFNNIFFYNLLYIKTLFLLKKYDEIIAYIEKNTDYVMESEEILTMFAASLFKLELWDQSFQVLRILMKNTKYSDYDYNINMAKIFINKTQYIKGIKILKPLSKRITNNNYVFFLLGLAHQKTGLINEAIYYYNKNINSHYGDEKSIFNLSLIYYDFNDFENAKKHLSMLENTNNPEMRKIFNKWGKKIELMDKSKRVKTIHAISKFVILFPLFLIIFSALVALFFVLILKYKG